MVFAFILISLLTAGGLTLTYLFDEKAPLWARAAAGAVIGQVLFGTIGFPVASLLGMNQATVAFISVLSASPLLLLRREKVWKRFRQDYTDFRNSAKSFVNNLPPERCLLVALYTALFALLWCFFDRAMIVKPEGIFIGAPNNLGDLPFHLQGIYGFTDGQNFPPENPSYTGSKFTYPFVVNLGVAMLVKLGAAVHEALFLQNMTLVLSLVGLLNYFTFRITKSRTAATMAPFLFLFSGGVGFMMFFYEAVKSEQGVFGLLMNLQNDYTLRNEGTWRWGNTLTVLLITQRSMLIGLPLTLVILANLWNFFFEHKKDDIEPKEVATGIPTNNLGKFIPFLILGFLAGTLPLVHAHSFAVLMGMAACFALFTRRRWLEWSVFFLAAGIVAVPELLWAMLGTANKTRTFIGREYGWDHGDQNIIWFWLKNTGLFIPLLLAAIALLIHKSRVFGPRSNDETEAETADFGSQTTNYKNLLLFWLPFALCFIVPNLVRLAPWIWDNIKVLIYWFVASVPLVAWLLSQIWVRGKTERIVAFGLILILTFAGFLDVWRVASGAFDYKLFDRDSVNMAKQIREKTPPRALIMSAPTYNTPVPLTGRRWFMGYIGHLWSHGIDPTPRENDLKRIYAGTPDAMELLKKNGIEYVIVSPFERELVDVNDAFFQKMPVIAQSGEYTLYQVK